MNKHWHCLDFIPAEVSKHLMQIFVFLCSALLDKLKFSGQFLRSLVTRLRTSWGALRCYTNSYTVNWWKYACSSGGCLAGKPKWLMRKIPYFFIISYLSDTVQDYMEGSVSCTRSSSHWAAFMFVGFSLGDCERGHCVGCWQSLLD